MTAARAAACPWELVGRLRFPIIGLKVMRPGSVTVANTIHRK